MKATDLTREIASIDQVLADAQHTSALQLYVLRKRRARLNKQLKQQQLHDKAAHTRQYTRNQLRLI